MGREGNPVYSAATANLQGIIYACERQKTDTPAFRNAPGNGIFNRGMLAVRVPLHYILHEAAKP